MFEKELNVIQVAYVKRKKSHRINNISQSLCWLELLGKSLCFLHQLHQPVRVNCWLFSSWIFYLAGFSKCEMYIADFVGFYLLSLSILSESHAPRGKEVLISQISSSSNLFMNNYMVEWKEDEYLVNWLRYISLNGGSKCSGEKVCLFRWFLLHSL